MAANLSRKGPSVSDVDLSEVIDSDFCSDGGGASMILTLVAAPLVPA